MKKSRLLVLAAAGAALCLATTACGGKHKHEYGAWTILESDKPTLTAGGTATRVCEADGDVQTFPVPALSDTSFWNVSTTQSPTHVTAGSVTYTSKDGYGTVIVETAAGEHTFGKWTITKEPTLTDKGKAERVCSESDGGKEETDVPALSDTTVWTKDASKSTPSSHTENGKDVYTSKDYGDVEVELPVLTEHVYGDWIFTKKPTLTEAGSATRECVGKDDTQTAPVPALSDSSWTKDEKKSTASTHTEKGKDVYVSAEFGEFEVELELLTTPVKVTYVIEEGDEGITKDVAFGSKLYDHLPELGLEVANGRYFDYWYAIVGGEEIHLTDDTLLNDEDDMEITVYAKWEKIPAYYGEFSGYFTQSSLYVGRTAALSITERGKITGKIQISSGTSTTFREIDGTVKSYVNQLVSWEDGSGATHFFLFDEASGLILFPEDLTSTSNEIEPNHFTLVRGGEVLDKVGIGYKPGNTTVQYYTGLIEYGTEQNSKFALFYNNGIVGDVTFTDAFGEALTFDTVDDSATLVVRNSEGTPVLAIGNAGGKLTASKDGDGNSVSIKPLDSYYGVFKIDGVDYKLDGLGNIVWGDKAGVYRFNADKSDANANAFDVFVRDRIVIDDGDDGDDGDDYGEWGEYSLRATTIYYVNKEHYVLKTAKTADGASSFEKEMATLSFSSSQAEKSPVSINTLVEYTLEGLDNTDTHVFCGWYANEGCTGDALTSITIDGATTVYAKWLEKVVITLNLSGQTCEGYPDTVEVGKGEPFTLDAPTSGAYLFVGWYTDADCTEGNEWILGETVVDGTVTTLYAKWEEPAYAGSFGGRNTYGRDNNGFSDVTLSITGGGAVTSSNSTLNGASVVSYDPETQLITLKKNTMTYYVYFDEVSGVLVTPHYSTMTEKPIRDDIYTFVKGVSANAVVANYAIGCRMTGGEFSSTGSTYYTRFLTVVNPDGGTRDLVLYNDRIYSGITIKNTAGETLTVADIKNSKSVVVYDKDGEMIFGVATAGVNLETTQTISLLDGLFGSYTGTFEGEEKELFVSGYGELTMGDLTGTYTLSNGKLQAYIGDSFYEITLDGEAYTCVKPMVTVTFNVNGGSAIAAVETNKNIAFAMPADPTRSGYVFRGWYLDSEFEQEATITEGKFTPSQTTTFYAKWDKVVTLTVVYGQGLDNAEITCAAHDTAIPLKPLHTNGKVFEKWVTRDGDGTETDYIPGEILDDTTIYAKWYENASEFTGEYQGLQLDGTTKAGAAQKGTRDYAQNVNAEGVTSAFPVGQISWKNRETGSILLTESDGTAHFGYYDEAHGLLIYNEGTNVNSFSAKIYVMFLNATTINTSASETIGCYWNSGVNKLFTVSPSGRAEDAITIFVNSDRAYVNVTLKSSTSGETLDVNNAYTAAEYLYVYAEEDTAQANPVATFKKDGDDGLLPYDVYAATYTTADGESVTFNGTGKATYDGKTGTYTFKELSEGKPAFEVVVDGKYYDMVIDGTSCTFVKRTVQVTFATNIEGVSLGAETFDYSTSTVSFPNAAKALLENSAYATQYVYLGIYSDAEYENTLNWAVAKDYTTVYVKLAHALTLTLHYNDGSDPEVIALAEGAEVDLNSYKPAELYQDGKVFKGWYIDEETQTPATFTEITKNEVVYAKWEVSNIFVNVSDTDSSYKYGFTETDGLYASGNQKQGSSSAQMSVTAFAPGTISFQYQVSTESGWDKMNILVGDTAKVKDFSGTSGDGKTSNSTPEEGKWLTFTADLEAGEKVKIRYTKDSSGDGGADTVWIRNISFVAFDMSSQGTYTGDGTDIVLDGRGKITRGEAEGTYEAISGVENTYDVFFKEGGINVSHYTLVIDMEAHTYVITANTVQITYNMNGHGIAPNADAFTGVALTLPTVTADGFIFQGWYTDAACTEGNEVTTVTPAADGTYSYYAKWAEAFTLTIVYGNGMESRVIPIASGDTVNLNNYKPKYANGMSFAGWYEDEAFASEVENTSFAIAANTTVYVKWEEGTPFEVESVTPNGDTDAGKAFQYDETLGAWITDSDTSGNEYLKIVINVSGTLTFKCKCVDNYTSSFYSDCQLVYEKYDADGNKIGGMSLTYASVKTGTLDDSRDWEEKTITVEVGQTIYIQYQKVNAEGVCQAGIKDIELS